MAYFSNEFTSNCTKLSLKSLENSTHNSSLVSIHSANKLFITNCSIDFETPNDQIEISCTLHTQPEQSYYLYQSLCVCVRVRVSAFETSATFDTFASVESGTCRTKLICDGSLEPVAQEQRGSQRGSHIPHRILFYRPQ